jgi:hypothetical protein
MKILPPILVLLHAFRQTSLEMTIKDDYVIASAQWIMGNGVLIVPPQALSIRHVGITSCRFLQNTTVG